VALLLVADKVHKTLLQKQEELGFTSMGDLVVYMANKTFKTRLKTKLSTEDIAKVVDEVLENKQLS